jgi:putative toxin-antitoxin system antitoxin component (TIGR02293 family)
MLMTIQTSTQSLAGLSSPMEIIALAKKGLPKRSVDVMAKGVGLTDREMARILNISERTFHRYKSDTILDTAATERLLKLFLLYKKGEEVFEDIEKFKSWVRHQHVLFGEKSPLDMLDTTTGFRLVEDELGRIEYGVYI